MSKKKRHIFGILSLLMVMLLAGCQGAANSQPEQKPVFIDEPGSPYPMVADRWELDLDGDGVKELVRLRAEKFYSQNETDGDDSWYEIVDGCPHPYTLLVTKAEQTLEYPLGWTSNATPPYQACYWGRSELFPIQDQDGQTVLVLGMESPSAGGRGSVVVYPLTYADGAIKQLDIMRYHIESVQQNMQARITVKETGYTQTLDLNHWLTQRGQSGVYNKDGSLSWPEAPRYADAPYRVEGLGNAIRLRQYLWGVSHVDGMGDLVTELTWKNGQITVLKQYMDWYG